MSRSASAVATSASRLMRATSGRPMLVMYSLLSRTSLMVKLMTSSPILLMSSAQVERMRSPTISGSLTICSTSDDFQPHLAHVVRAGRAHAVAHHFRLFDDLLDGELADDSAEMAFHDQANQAFALVRILAQELLRGGED